MWALSCCYLTAFAAIITAGALGPHPIKHKIFRDIDFDHGDVEGTEVKYSEETGDALWSVHLHKLVPEKQFLHMSTRLQRPGWSDGPTAARSIDFHYTQEYTLYSQMGSDTHILAAHSDAYANHTHTHHVSCKAHHRFCDPFQIYHKDYLSASAVHLEVLPPLQPNPSLCGRAILLGFWCCSWLGGK